MGNFGYVPSLANASDDPTRDLPVRSPAREPPSWWEPACSGDFGLLDEWLQKLGYDPISVAGLPFKPDAEVDVDAVKGSFLADLRRVQKPERLAEFDRNRLSNGIVSHFDKQREQDLIKTGKQEPEGQTKKDKKR